MTMLYLSIKTTTDRNSIEKLNSRYEQHYRVKVFTERNSMWHLKKMTTTLHSEAWFCSAENFNAKQTLSLAAHVNCVQWTQTTQVICTKHKVTTTKISLDSNTTSQQAPDIEQAVVELTPMTKDRPGACR